MGDGPGPACEHDHRAQLDAMARPWRLMLKRAWPATRTRPLWIAGPAMQAVAVAMIDARLVRAARADAAAVTLTTRGFALATILRRDGWPRCEKPRA